MHKNLPHSTLIDVGCGDGAFLNFASGYHSFDLFRVVGIDLTATPMQGKVELIKCDFRDYVFDEKFDYVVSFAVIEHVSDVRLFLEKLQAICCENGHIVIMTINEASTLYSFAKALRFLGVRTPMERLYDSHHIHHFTASSFEVLVNRTPGLLIRKRLYHNIAMRAVDFPYKSVLVRGLAKLAVRLAFLLGNGFTKKTYLQTYFLQKVKLM